MFTRYLDQESFVNAIAPKGDLTKIGRAQFAVLFRVADTSRRGLVSWEDFVVFETVLKRPDADYWMAFQYFDTCVAAFLCFSVLSQPFPRDHSGFIDYNEFRSVMSASISPDSIPFDFDWCVSWMDFFPFPHPTETDTRLQ